MSHLLHQSNFIDKLNCHAPLRDGIPTLLLVYVKNGNIS